MDSANPVVVCNALPVTLKHYESELFYILSEAGIDARKAEVPGAEVSGLSNFERFQRLAALLAAPPRLSWSCPRSTNVLVLWPVFGFLEPLVWLLASVTLNITILIHDAEPLRRQVGMGRTANWLGAVVSRRGWIKIVVHSAEARQALVDRGWRVTHTIRHPVGPFRGEMGVYQARSRIVTVLGQYKESRDTILLRELGRSRTLDDYSRLIRGRGWPTVAGWQTESRFLTEEEFDETLSCTGVLLVPYRNFYQSGVAVRALEMGTPVVVRRTTFTEELLGMSWLGLTEDKDSAADTALKIARAQSASDLYRLWHRYKQEALQDWQDSLCGVGRDD